MALCTGAALAPCHKDCISETPEGQGLGWQSCTTDRQGCSVPLHPQLSAVAGLCCGIPPVLPLPWEEPLPSPAASRADTFSLLLQVSEKFLGDEPATQRVLQQEGWQRSWLPLESLQPGQSCHPALLPSTSCCQTTAGALWGPMRLCLLLAALLLSQVGRYSCSGVPTAPAAKAGLGQHCHPAPCPAGSTGSAWLCALVGAAPGSCSSGMGANPALPVAAVPRQRPHSCSGEDGSSPELCTKHRH